MRNGIEVVRPGRIFTVGILMALLLLTILTLILLFKDYKEQSDVPEPLREEGHALIFFDRPSVAASMDVRISSRRDELHSSEYSISLDDQYSGPSVRFFLTLSGTARVPEVNTIGGPDVRANGCWSDIHIVLESELSASCYKRKLGTGTGYLAPGLGVDTQVITGLLNGSDPMRRWTTVTTYDVGRFSVSAGKRTYFTLPGIGTPFVPESSRSKARKDLGLDRHGFVPGKLDVSIDYGTLAPSEKLDNVAPEPFESGSRAWVEFDASIIAAHGSVVDTVREEEAQNKIFVFGAFVGIAATVLPIIIERLIVASHKVISGFGEDDQQDRRSSPGQRVTEVDPPGTRRARDAELPGTAMLRRQLQHRASRRL